MLNVSNTPKEPKAEELTPLVENKPEENIKPFDWSVDREVRDEDATAKYLATRRAIDASPEMQAREAVALQESNARVAIFKAEADRARAEKIKKEEDEKFSSRARRFFAYDPVEAFMNLFRKKE